MLDTRARPRRLSWRERLSGVSRPAPSSEFLRGLKAPQFFGWNPALRDPRQEHRKAYYDVVRRAIDAIHNSGWLSGGVEQATTQMCGPMLSLNARPHPSLFGGNVADAAKWAREVEARFTSWARVPYSVDFVGQQDLGQMCAQAIKGWFGYGEILALLRFDKRPGNSLGTKLQLLPPTRCPHNKNSVVDRSTQQGVELDDQGRPRAYWIANPAAAEWMPDREKKVQARDEAGRPVVVHVHDSPPTVIRGMTPLAPALQVVRQFDQLSNATLTAALIQAIFAATIESDAPTDQLLEALQDVNEADATAGSGALDALMDAKMKWYDRTNIDLGTFGKVIHLFMGEKLDFKRSEHPNDNYQPFARFLLLEIARCLGITYEQLTGDWREATYTSGRMGAAENWLTNLCRRRHIAGPLMSAVYSAWLEEEIESGFTEFPGGLAAFLANRDLACEADWRGPPKPTADDFKTARANETKLKNKVITREMWCADEGTDVDNVFEQLKREEDRAEELGIDLAVEPSNDGGKSTAELTGAPGVGEEDK